MCTSNNCQLIKWKEEAPLMHLSKLTACSSADPILVLLFHLHPRLANNVSAVSVPARDFTIYEMQDYMYYHSLVRLTNPKRILNYTSNFKLSKKLISRNKKLGAM